MKFVVGIDEVGRGPLAGPVTVGLFAGERKMEKWLLENVFHGKLRDSKKLKEKERETIAKKLSKLKKEGKVFFAVTHVSNKVIDKKGISFTINYAIKKNFGYIKHSVFNRVDVRLDGGLKAPSEFKNQKTIIKGDEKDVWIACASIVAKVSRDALMCRLAKKYPVYGFEVHKGYGTKKHSELIKKHGISPAHRKSFCKNLQYL